jgi:UDP-glucose 4-epimerase
MNILITGAAGFVGRALVPRLIQQDHRILATGRGPSPFASHPALTWGHLDLSAHPDTWPDLAGIDLVYHLGWSTVPASASREPADDLQTNVIGSVRLFQRLLAQGRPKIVFTSSGGTVYGILRAERADEAHPLEPISAYGVSKRAVESFLAIASATSGCPFAVLRIGNLYGPGQNSRIMFGAVTQFARNVIAGRPVVMFGDGEISRDYVFIDDVIDVMLLAGSGHATGIFNVGTGTGRTLNEVARQVGLAAGTAPAIRYEPPRQFDVPTSVLDSSLAAAALGWWPATPFDEGVRRTVAFLRAAGVGE